MTEKKFLENISEGITDISVYKTKEKDKGPGTRKKGLPFYNPSMELNRDMSILLVQWFVNNRNKTTKILDGLASSGIRGIRFANEIKGDFEVYINDWSKNAYNLIKKNIKNNELKNTYAFNNNLNSILSSEKFDYIDIDPFGSPVYFFDSAVRSVKHNGIIAFTATDTASLCGVYPKVCVRRYDAVPYHSIVMKEIGIRIILGCIARIASRYDKGILPLISYATDHYFRAYVKISDNISSANDSISKVKLIKKGKKVGLEKTDKNIGPLWMDKLNFKRVFNEIIPILSEKKLGCKNSLYKMIDILNEETDAPCFYYTTDGLSSYFKTSPPKKRNLFNFLEKKGYTVGNTHFDSTGFKTDATIDVIEKMFK